MIRIAIEGGGCRSAYSSGVLQVLEEEQVPVESIIGSSSGSMNAAFFAAKQSDAMVELWRNEKSAKRMVSVARFLNPFAPPGLNIDDLVDNFLNKEGSLDPVRATGGETALYTMAVNVDEMKPVAHRPDEQSLWSWLKASMAMPLAYNRIVTIDGVNYVDGGVLDPVPFKADMPQPSSGITAVILTRRAEVRKAAPPVWAKFLMQMATHPNVVKATLVQHLHHNNLMDELTRLDQSGEVLLSEPPVGMPVSRLTTDGPSLRAGHEQGREAGYDLVRRIEARLRELGTLKEI